MKIRLLLLLASASAVITLSGCYPGGPEYIDDYDIVSTAYNQTYDFGALHSFALPSKIVKITDDLLQDPSKIKYLNTTISDPILDRIRKNMIDRGYVEEDSANADAILLVAAWEITNVSIYYDWGYWGWYYPGYSPGWGWYYPYYPTYPVTTSYKTGSVMIQFTDPNTIDQNVSVEWLAIINGLAEGGTTSIISRSTKSVDQAFAQSPYIIHEN